MPPFCSLYSRRTPAELLKQRRARHAEEAVEVLASLERSGFVPAPERARLHDEALCRSRAQVTSTMTRHELLEVYLCGGAVG